MPSSPSSTFSRISAQLSAKLYAPKESKRALGESKPQMKGKPAQMHGFRGDKTWAPVSDACVLLCVCVFLTIHFFKLCNVYLLSPNDPQPTMEVECAKANRANQGNMQRSDEFLDSKAVLKAKVKKVAALIRCVCVCLSLSSFSLRGSCAYMMYPCHSIHTCTHIYTPNHTLTLTERANAPLPTAVPVSARRLASPTTRPKPPTPWPSQSPPRRSAISRQSRRTRIGLVT
jgi:hypothetical protein